MSAPKQLVSGAKESVADQSLAPAPPVISLPKGGGAIRGMGERFAANPVTGTGSMSVPRKIAFSFLRCAGAQYWDGSVSTRRF